MYTSFVEDGQFATILSGHEDVSCQLTRLKLFGTVSDAELVALLSALPCFSRLEHLLFSMRLSRRWKTRMLSAFWRNRSLLKSSIRNECFSYSEKAKLLAYHDRNGVIRTTLNLQP
jgi:hypothetical protein